MAKSMSTPQTTRAGRLMRTGLAVMASAVIAVGTLAARPQDAPTATALAARVQAHYATVRDFTAVFTLTHSDPLMPKPVTDRGEVKVKKPDRMRWTYTTGDRQQFVSDGTMTYAYFPRDRYVERAAVPRENQASTAIQFLAGRGDITRDFTASLPADQPAGEWRLLLHPRTKQADFTSLTLEVDRTSLALRGLIATDDQGGTSAFRFAELRENRGLTDREFEFVMPRGVEVR